MTEVPPVYYKILEKLIHQDSRDFLPSFESRFFLLQQHLEREVTKKPNDQNVRKSRT